MYADNMIVANLFSLRRDHTFAMKNERSWFQGLG